MITHIKIPIHSDFFILTIFYSPGDRQENRRHAAALVLRELAANAPTLIYTYVPQILEMIWVGLRDPKVAIREASAEALSACLQIIHERENSQKQQWYTKIYDEAGRGLKTNNADHIHGSLLAYRELLRHAQTVCDCLLYSVLLCLFINDGLLTVGCGLVYARKI